jgi:hypothetical protein
MPGNFRDDPARSVLEERPGSAFTGNLLHADPIEMSSLETVLAASAEGQTGQLPMVVRVR